MGRFHALCMISGMFRRVVVVLSPNMNKTLSRQIGLAENAKPFPGQD
jgi:hypothetical protein